MGGWKTVAGQINDSGDCHNDRKSIFSNSPIVTVATAISFDHDIRTSCGDAYADRNMFHWTILTCMVWLFGPSIGHAPAKACDPYHHKSDSRPIHWSMYLFPALFYVSGNCRIDTSGKRYVPIKIPSWNDVTSFLLSIIDFLFVVIVKVPMIRTALEKCRLDLWSIAIMNWRIWPLTNLINFGIVPYQFRVLVNQIVSFFWFAYLSTRV